MMSGELDAAAARQLIVATIRRPDFRRAAFGGKPRGPSVWLRVAVRPVEVQGQPAVQFSYFDAKQDITKNARGAEIDARLGELFACDFANVHLTAGSDEIDLRTTKKGKLFASRRQVTAAPVTTAHNRAKAVPLPEGPADRLLEALGILTRDGTVRPTQRAKWTQINEFLLHLDVALTGTKLEQLDRPVEILDCGCGSSFLTLAAHHYLNEVRGLPARVTGVDANAEVIRTSADRANRLGVEGVTFRCGPIRSADTPADIVLALHACDTATDDALAAAVNVHAKVLLSVPCCHHHLNDSLRSDVLRPLLRHGILRQRTADLVTDSFRALALRIMGYRTDVVEFISTEHTARNLMIRAVAGLSVGDTAFVREYCEYRDFWGVTPYLEAAFGQRFQELVSG